MLVLLFLLRLRSVALQGELAKPVLPMVGLLIVATLRVITSPSKLLLRRGATPKGRRAGLRLEWEILGYRILLPVVMMVCAQGDVVFIWMQSSSMILKVIFGVLAPRGEGVILTGVHEAHARAAARAPAHAAMGPQFFG